MGRGEENCIRQGKRVLKTKNLQVQLMVCMFIAQKEGASFGSINVVSLRRGQERGGGRLKERTGFPLFSRGRKGWNAKFREFFEHSLRTDLP